MLLCDKPKENFSNQDAAVMGYNSLSNK